MFQYLHNLYLAMDPKDQDALKSTIGPTVAILLFVATQALQIFLAHRSRSQEVKRTLIGLYREISENTRNGRKLLDQVGTVAAIKKRLENDDAAAAAAGKSPAYRPLLVITESSQFYDASASTIPSLHADCLLAVTAYYRSVMDQRLTAESIASYAFLYITLQGRCDTIDELWEAFKESCDRGNAALNQFEARYPRSWFKQLKP